MTRKLRIIGMSLLILLPAGSLLSQDEGSVTLQDIMKFKETEDASISDNGQWVAHTAEPDRGDPEVMVYSADGEVTYSLELADDPVISHDGRWVAARRVAPALEQINAGKGKDRPVPGVVLLDLQTGEKTVYDSIRSFSFSNDGAWLLMHHEKGEEEKKKNGKSEKSPKAGTQLSWHALAEGEMYEHHFVTTYALDSLSTKLAFTVRDTNGTGNGVYGIDLANPGAEPLAIFADSAAWGDELTWNNRTGSLAFLGGVLNEDGKQDQTTLYLLSQGKSSAAAVMEDADLEKEWRIYHKNRLQWSTDGKRLFLGTKPDSEIIVDEEEENDSITNLFDTGKILDRREVDVWHWDDPYINPHQKKRWSREKDNVYTGVYYPGEDRFVQLEDPEMPGVMVNDSERYFMGYSRVPYAKLMTWDGRYNDFYLVDIQTGERELVLEKQRHEVWPSPDGQFLVYYRNGNWSLVETASGEVRKLTHGLPVPFSNEDWDYPADVPGYGVAGWMKGSEAVLIYDKYDIWQFSTDGGEPVCLTGQLGRDEKLRFRVRKLDREKEYLEPGERLVLSAYHDLEKYTAVYSMKVGRKGVKRLADGPKKYSVLAKAKDAGTLLYTRESYREYPDLWVTGSKWRNPEQLSGLGEQTDGFAWGDTELIEWISVDGTPVQGILIKPGNYDPDKQYPVLVYYYRFFTQRMYNFPDMSINHRPTYPYYASNGYAIFLPDIRFDVGTPGYAATKSLVPGVQKLIDMGVADPDAIALHGHSWSGYQTAFMITQTDLFACAIAGAPVSNMTSAYSGIRWGSGMARQFQYEKSQSRIGGSLWEARDEYIENSPVFFADRINTPLLIQFGDEDGAVPWYQGIELYLAMRRLEKDCVFLQYRGEPHHLKKYANKLDYTIKFKEYLDHYLKGEPAAGWIKDGVPYRGEQN